MCRNLGLNNYLNWNLVRIPEPTDLSWEGKRGLWLQVAVTSLSWFMAEDSPLWSQETSVPLPRSACIANATLTAAPQLLFSERVTLQLCEARIKMKYLLEKSTLWPLSWAQILKKGGKEGGKHKFQCYFSDAPGSPKRPWLKCITSNYAQTVWILAVMLLHFNEMVPILFTL